MEIEKAEEPEPIEVGAAPGVAEPQPTAAPQTNDINQMFKSQLNK